MVGDGRSVPRERVARKGCGVGDGKRRRWGLSPRARRVVLPVLGVAASLVIVGQALGLGARTGGVRPDTPHVGGDLHAVAALGSHLYVSGHDGAGVRTGGAWTQLSTLDEKDVMAWARIGAEVLAGGHQGLYVSSDGGIDFTPVPNTEGLDVHGLGAAGSAVYLASPASGLFVSHDGGASFAERSQVGRAFMGTIWVDPRDSRVAIALSMQGGAVRTTDGGRTWSSLSGPRKATGMAVADDGRDLVVLGPGEARRSTDGGTTWDPLDVPPQTTSATFTSRGELVVAALHDGQADVYRLAGNTWAPLT